MKKWAMVVVLGRPSASTRDFFNSIKFHTYQKEAENHTEAIGDVMVPEAAYEGGYEMLNWYAFPEDADGAQEQK